MTENKNIVEKISIKKLDFYYGNSRALKQVTLPLYQNMVTAFIGPSGAESRLCCVF